jgi:hypothetical protein
VAIFAKVFTFFNKKGLTPFLFICDEFWPFGNKKVDANYPKDFFGKCPFSH